MNQPNVNKLKTKIPKVFNSAVLINLNIIQIARKV